MTPNSLVCQPVIEEPTCLILGAGASAPYGLPTTAQLKDLILSLRSRNGTATSEKFPLQAPIRDALNRDFLAQQWNVPAKSLQKELPPAQQWNRFVNEVAGSAHLQHVLGDFFPKFHQADRSIDWFLRRNESTYGDVARLLIAAVLLNCERTENLTGDWYQLLSTEILARNLDTLERGKLSIITFNYDRSFERYFLNQFQHLCGLSANDAYEALSRIRLEHAYGDLGHLDQVAYGDASKSIDAARHINVIRAEPDKAIQDRLRPLIRESRYINFIGFGFDEDNIDLLGSENFRNRRVYSTSYGLAARVRKKATEGLGVQFDDTASGPLTAAQLFETKDLFGPRVEVESSDDMENAVNESDFPDGNPAGM